MTKWSSALFSECHTHYMWHSDHTISERKEHVIERPYESDNARAVPHTFGYKRTHTACTLWRRAPSAGATGCPRGPRAGGLQGAGDAVLLRLQGGTASGCDLYRVLCVLQLNKKLTIHERKRHFQGLARQTGAPAAAQGDRRASGGKTQQLP